MEAAIGIATRDASQKDRFIQRFREVFRENKDFSGIEVFDLSNILNKTFDGYGIQKTLKNHKRWRVMIDQTFGSGTFLRWVHKKIRDSFAEIIIVSGISRLEDIEILKSLPKNLLVYISDAEPAKNLDDILIPVIGKMANVAIAQNESEEAFKEKIQALYFSLKARE